MANEITLNCSMTLANPSTRSNTVAQLSHQFAPGSLQFNQTTQLMFAEAISMATSDTAYSFTGVTTQGMCAVQNLDATNYVDIGPASGGALVPFIRLKPREIGVFRLNPSCTFRAQANTAACKVLLVVYND